MIELKLDSPKIDRQNDADSRLLAAAVLRLNWHGSTQRVRQFDVAFGMGSPKRGRDIKNVMVVDESLTTCLAEFIAKYCRTLWCKWHL